jgi:large subunit ribosomal protein L9
MKVILKSEVDNLGLPGDVVDVADGYGRNFLLPRGLAILATKGAMKEAEALTRSRKAREAQTVGAAEAAKEVLESRTLRLAARVDERGHLYGSVSAHDVQRVLKERGHDIERKRIELKGTIKQIGEYEIPVHVHPQVTATVTVEVVDEEGKVTLHGAPEPEVDEAAVEAAAAEAAEGSETDVEALAEQALEAAKQYEQEQGAAEDEDAADATDAEEPAEQV